MGGVFHFDLEGVALETDLVQLDRLEHLAAVALESGGGIVHLEAGHEADVGRGVVRHEDAPEGPVDHVHAVAVARSDGHVGALFGAGGVEPKQVLGVVAEVGVHLKNEVVAVLDGPLKTADVGRAEALLAAAFDQMQPPGELALEAFDDVGRAVGRAVVDDQYVEGLLQAEDDAEDVFDVLFFVVRRDDDDAVRFHTGYCLSGVSTAAHEVGGRNVALFSSLIFTGQK